jgi:hypothetical protein
MGQVRLEKVRNPLVRDSIDSEALSLILFQ